MGKRRPGLAGLDRIDSDRLLPAVPDSDSSDGVLVGELSEFDEWLLEREGLLIRKLGEPLRMKHPDGLTERQKLDRHRAATGYRAIGFLPPEAGAAMLYLKKQWGFKTNVQTAAVALLYLTKHTREGLKEIKLGVD